MSGPQDRARGAHMRWEMTVQADVVRRLAARRAEITTLVRELVPSTLRGVTLVARGSSDNAAVHGRYLIEAAAKVPVALAAPSLQTRYGVTPRMGDHLVIGVSQSGATPEIVDTVRRLSDGGARTLAVTNDPDSPLASIADAALTLEAGDERAVPATKTFTAQTATMVLVAAALGPLPGWDPDTDGDAAWQRAADAVDTVLSDDGPVGALAARLQAADHVLPVARGLLYAGALEIGLKLAETTGVAVRGTSSADLQHGPIATAHAGTLALCLATPGPVADDIARIAALLRRRDARVVVISPDPALVPMAHDRLAVPPDIPEPLAIIPTVVRGQQLALATSLAAGIDPDRPFALHKVTPTS